MTHRYNNADMIRRAGAIHLATGCAVKYISGSQVYGRPHAFHLTDNTGAGYTITAKTKSALIDASFYFTDGFRAAELIYGVTR